MSYLHGKVTIICNHCQASKEVYHSWAKRQYCSNTCRIDARKGKPTWGSIHFKKGMRTNTGKTHFRQGQQPWNKGLLGYHAEETHVNWQAENPSYRAVHAWINKKLGQPNNCELCGTTTAKRFEWANKTGKYLRDITDWMRLCKSCHNIYDNTGYKSWDTRRGVVGL